MTPKEKAKELFEWAIKYGASKEVAKLFATRTVDEILLHEKNNHSELDKISEYWQEVKKEIEKL